MATNPTIALGVQRPQQKDAAVTLAQMLQLQGAMEDRDARRQASQDASQTREIFARGGGNEQISEGLRSAGLVDPWMQFQSHLSELGTEELNQKKIELDMVKEALGVTRTVMDQVSAVPDPAVREEAYQSALGFLQQNVPGIAQQLPPQYDEAALAQFGDAEAALERANKELDGRIKKQTLTSAQAEETRTQQQFDVEAERGFVTPSASMQELNALREQKLAEDPNADVRLTTLLREIAEAGNIPTPGRDVPFSPDVEAQNVRMQHAGRAPTRFEQELAMFRDDPEAFHQFMGREPELALEMLESTEPGEINGEDTLWNRVDWMTTGLLSAPFRRFGQMTGTFQEQSANVQAFRNARSTMLSALQENPRFATSEREQLGKDIDIQPGTFKAGAEIRTRMREIDNHLAETEQRRAAQNDVASVLAIREFRNKMGVPPKEDGEQIGVTTVRMPDGSTATFGPDGRRIGSGAGTQNFGDAGFPGR